MWFKLASLFIFTFESFFFLFVYAVSFLLGHSMEILSIISWAIFISWFWDVLFCFYLLFPFLYLSSLRFSTFCALCVFICIRLLRSLIGMCYIYTAPVYCFIQIPCSIFETICRNFGIKPGLCSGNSVAAEKKKKNKHDKVSFSLSVLKWQHCYSFSCLIVARRIQ